jgi:serine protease SohB
MREFLLQYGLFLAETLTILAAVAAVILLIASASRRERGEGSFKLDHLNRRYEDTTRLVEQAMLPHHALKRVLKKEKAHEKARRREDKRNAKKTGKDGERPRGFVLSFQGDIRATEVASLRQEVTAVLSVAKPEDEVIVHLENAGGLVHEHGLAASQLHRIRERGIRLTVLVDKVAASGGYMMACVADRIVAAPFAVIGSIGVLAQLPNFNRLLERHGVDLEQLKAGDYKRTITMFGKNTDQDRKKFQEELEDTHHLFKDFVAEQRPAVDIDAVSTGEHWYATRALDLKLVDEIGTSDDYLVRQCEHKDLYEVIYTAKKSLGEKLASALHTGLERALTMLAQRDWESRLK